MTANDTERQDTSEKSAMARLARLLARGSAVELWRSSHRVQGMTPTNAKRLGQLDDPALLRRFLLLPHDEIRRVEASGKINQLTAVRVSVLLAIAILSHAPMRLKNLVALDLDAHIRLPAAGRPGETQILIPADEVKNYLQTEYVLPEEVTSLLRLYIERYRYLLLRGSNSAGLFPGRSGKPKDQGLFSKQISKLI